MEACALVDLLRDQVQLSGVVLRSPAFGIVSGKESQEKEEMENNHSWVCLEEI